MNDLFLDVKHLKNTYIVNRYDDMCILQDSAKKSMLPVPQLIVYSFDVPRYEETSKFAGLEACPDIVANVFLDYMDVSDNNFESYSLAVCCTLASHSLLSDYTYFVNISLSASCALMLLFSF